MHFSAHSSTPPTLSPHCHAHSHTFYLVIHSGHSTADNANTHLPLPSLSTEERPAYHSSTTISDLINAIDSNSVTEPQHSQQVWLPHTPFPPYTTLLFLTSTNWTCPHRSPTDTLTPHPHRLPPLRARHCFSRSSPMRPITDLLQQQHQPTLPHRAPRRH